MQSNTRMKHCFTPTRIAIIKKSDNKVSGMLRNQNSHTHPCEVPSHSESDTGEMTSQLCQKTEKELSPARLSCRKHHGFCPALSWITHSGQSQPRGHEDTQPAFWRRPHGETLPTASTVTPTMCNVEGDLCPNQAFRWLQPQQTLSQNLRPRPIPDPWPRDMVWDSKRSFFPKPATFWVTCCVAIGSVYLSHKMQTKQHPQMAKRELQLQLLRTQP